MTGKVDVKEAVNIIESFIKEPSNGLPEDVFLFASRITPMVNVDLLIKNERNQTLLTWRDDRFYMGWHVPGGIIRYKETFSERIRAVAKTELGAEVEFQMNPIAINEIIHRRRRERGHFISLLCQCSLITPPDEELRYHSGAAKSGQWMWHETCPENIIPVHEIYRQYI